MSDVNVRSPKDAYPASSPGQRKAARARYSTTRSAQALATTQISRKARAL